MDTTDDDDYLLAVYWWGKPAETDVNYAYSNMIDLELAVLALARIMCAYIHSQNGSAILAQA